jgi:hypothetical protein
VSGRVPEGLFTVLWFDLVFVARLQAWWCGVRAIYDPFVSGGEDSVWRGVSLACVGVVP